MGRLRIGLLGAFEVRDAGRLIGAMPRKATALLAYLARRPGQPHAREKLAALLWGEASDAAARDSLRHALVALRKALPAVGRVLTVEGSTLALVADAVEVDVARFEAALDTDPILASELYRGDLLDGFELREAAFEDWLRAERAWLRERAADALASLVERHETAGRYREAAECAQRLLALDPAQEHVHRRLMRLQLRQGRRAAALRQYQACVDALRRELDVDPEPETRQLYRDILRDGDTAPEAARAASSAAANASAAPGEMPMLGRGVELQRLQAVLQRLPDAGGGVSLLHGEAGIGKSRLIRAFAALAAERGVPVAIGRCHETEQILPLQPWVDALRGEAGALPADIRGRLGAAASAELARVFPELSRVAGAPASAGEHYALLFESMLQLIGALGAGQPAIYVLEDLHWADALSLRFLAFLGRRIGRLPILVVASLRPEELVDAPVLAQVLTELRAEGRLDEHSLRPLSAADSRALADALHPPARRGADWEQLAGGISAASEGNPFVIVESVRALGDASPGTPADAAPIARGVQDFVAGRLERLVDGPRHAVAVAAAIGREFSFELLAHASGIGERAAADAVEQLVRRGILMSTGNSLDFCHDWIRRVAYERVLPQARAALHAAVAAALEDLHREQLDDVVDQLGHHHALAGNARKAIAHLIRFHQLASRGYAMDDGLRALQRAMAVVALLPQDERDTRTLDLALRQALVMSMLGRQREIHQLLQANAERVERVPDPLLVSEYHFRVGLTCFYLGDRVRGQRAGELALGGAERAGDPMAIGKALHVLSLSAFEAGRPRDGIALATRAIPLLDLPQAQAWLGLVYYDLALNSLVAGDLDAALAAAERQKAIGRDGKIPRLQPLAESNTAWVLAVRGEHEAAVAVARRSLELARDPTVSGLAAGALGLAYLEQGDGASAVAALTQAVEQLRSHPARNAEARRLAWLGEAQLLVGDPELAQASALKALELAQTDGMMFTIGIAQRALGRVARARPDAAEAAAHLSQAHASFMDCGATFEAACTAADLAGACARRGEADAARRHLAAAIAVFESANAPRRTAGVLALARELGCAPAEA